MSERKVLNKYIPPDFDPDALRRHKKLLKADGFGKKESPLAIKLKYGDSKLMNIRMMFPFTFRCEACRDFTYVGTKFNSRVQRLDNDTYLGIVKWRFFGKCPNCKHEIVFKTDPKNGDYTLESGGTRTYDAHRDEHLASEQLSKEQEEKNETLGTTEKMAEKADHAFAEYEQLERLTALKRRAGRMRERENLAELSLQRLQKRSLEFEEGNQEELDLFKREQSELYSKYCEPAMLSDDLSSNDGDLESVEDDDETPDCPLDEESSVSLDNSSNSAPGPSFTGNAAYTDTSTKTSNTTNSSNTSNSGNIADSNTKDNSTNTASGIATSSGKPSVGSDKLYSTKLKVQVKPKSNPFTFNGYESDEDGQ
ncbi:uncharacterized protein TOT_030000777 [Theileria orientalis strain Shintoku]|uniref:Splicing factor YJU2 n=1 Tax=Theileria orientalis strain Shintoku TaxID=869250 RepID=J4D9P5_THEOR|nr:uncharacterized protein TOT_030000777 [Theileria orientalis strain Shintoku]BAM41515.1 uncharacterized protein TOT_030000777 [Theileria orientalis strain Shintoku]|eukprot:XP_009691816.1 uncharacterized protein TOT_030000777 [Theileria orientalis strain Shintoku]